VKEWNGEELEEAGEKAGIPMPLARNIKDVLKMDAFTKSVGLMPLVSVEKVGETDPIPFTTNPKTPLESIRQLATTHVIAGHRSVARWPCMAPTPSTCGGHPMSNIRSGTTPRMSECGPPCLS
jgi:hypothetical protein